MTIKVFDVSEFQGGINWAAVVDPGIVRIHNGWRPDNFWRQNLAGARAHCSWRGWYQYLPASVDPVRAAHDFQATMGPTLPGEVMILDLEEGSGDQRGRRQAWLNALQDPIEWTYSGMYFARQHLPGVRVEWLAAYGQGEPTDSHTLWQFTNAQRFAGIASPCDGSVFNGTLSDLVALTGGPHTAPSAPSRTDTRPPLPTPTGGLIVRTIDLRAASSAHPVTGLGVKPLQRLLGITADGVGGDHTRWALGEQQRVHHIAADFIFGPGSASAFLAGN